MIFYFSGTGNSEYVANLIGERTGEEVINIADCVKRTKYHFILKKGERVGFVYVISLLRGRGIVESVPDTESCRLMRDSRRAFLNSPWSSELKTEVV